ncbi:MupA/Atu3671 family FMN-dependent luciferase-like monooxygenase [Pendulispora albinea]|uniref:Aminotransferase class I/II-fold pyridoxal phosphate-dependent enzyme n=1 Tax=Pendulispora albinea TaxID=2741071 RepID=A0ABZ2LLF0_9BACT
MATTTRSFRTDAETLIDVLARRAALTPDRVAYSYLRASDHTTTHMTYGELLAMATGMAAELDEMGFRGSRVLVVSEFGRHYVGAFLGCMLAGRIPVPVAAPRAPGALRELATVAADCDPAAIVAPRTILDGLRSASAAHEPLARLAWLASDECGRAPPAHGAIRERPAPEDIAFIQYTSGSVSAPRGVVVRHANLTHNLATIQRVFGHSSESRGVIWLPPNHDMGLVGGILQPLYAGFPVVLMPPSAFLRNPLTWLQAIAEHKATTSGGPNFAYDYCVRKIASAEAAQLDLSHWAAAFVGAEPIDPRVLESFARHFASGGFRRSAFLPCYGLAESTLFVSGARHDQGPKIAAISISDLDRGVVTPAREAARAIVGCGALQAGSALIVDPRDDVRCEPGRIGEIWLRGPSVAAGYWNNDAETTAVFRARPAGDADGPDYLRTGDLGFELDGDLYITGRLKELIIVRGRNICPQDIERSIEEKHPWLRGSGCAAVSDHVDGEERLAVLLELEPKKLPKPPTSLEELEVSIRESVSREHGLDVHRVVFVRPGQLPKTTSGKIRRVEARSLFLDRKSSEPSRDEPSRDEPYARLVAWAARHFAVEPATLDGSRTWVSLGLDSLKAAELNTYLEQHFGYTVSAERLFDGLTLSGLASELVSHPTVRIAPSPPPVQEVAAPAREAACVPRQSPASPVDFSLFFFSSDAERDQADKYRLFLECAAFADHHGFRAIWTPERHFHRFGGLFPNPAVLGAALAATTKRIRIRAGSVVLPLHDPVRVAEEWSTVDNLSSGRVDLAFATGWNADDFVLGPDRYASRERVLFEGVDQIRRLWRGESIVRPNGRGDPTRVRIFPAPIQGELPTWVTCSGGVERFEQAGRLGANVLTALLFQDVDELRTKLDAYRRARTQGGHDPDAGIVTLMLHTFIGSDERFVRRMVEAPFKTYLRDSVDLWRRGSTALDSLTKTEQATVLDYAFERYFHTSAMFGTPERASELVARLASAGVREIACLIDFGIDRGDVLNGLRDLGRLERRWRANGKADDRPRARHEDHDLGEAVRNRHALAHRNSGGVLQKARDFDLARRLEEANLLPFYPDLSDSDGVTCAYEGRRLLMLGSNNYLGLTADRRVREAAAAAAMADGPSVTGSRLMNGSTPAHAQLERKLAGFLGREDAVLLTTGYQANIGLLSAFMGKGTVLVVDEECHASIYDGVAVGGGKLIVFRHNDVADLDRRLSSELQSMPAMVMVDGVYSMSGDIAPLAEIREVCDRYGVPLALDDAHGLGMIGARGRGVEEAFGMLGCADVLTGTFSKSLASVGGWLAGSRHSMDWVRYHGRSMLFSASMPPPSVAAAAAALDILMAEPERVEKIRELSTYWRNGLRARGFDTGHSKTAIVPVIIGDELTCMRFAKRLCDSGVYANCVMAPAVPAHRAMMRTTVTAAHDMQHLDAALEIFERVGRELGIVPQRP